jgi:G3E family GTPase
MEKIIQTGRFNRIIVEPSGLGGTDHITELASQHPGLQLMPVICLVDITMTRNLRLKMLPIYKSQILKADLVLFTKSELLTEPEMTELTEKFQADFPGKKCRLKTQFDFQLSFQKEGTRQIAWNLPDKKTPDASELSLTFPSSQSINIRALKEILENEISILRAKGYIYCGNEWLLFNYTLSGLTTETCQPRTSNELAIIFEGNDNQDFLAFSKKVDALYKMNDEV